MPPLSLNRIENVLLHGNFESKESRLEEIVLNYKDSIQLCKKLSLENLKAFEQSLEDNIDIYEDVELFKKVIILSAKKGPGTIEKIYDLEEKRWYFAN